MPPIVKDTGVPGSPVISKSDKSTLLQMPTAYRPGAETAGRVQPVALEVPVSVNGARTLDGTDTREPFSETTKTVLVLGNGAVIRLNAPVAPGQLLFLTNQKTKREVVCQVVKSKTYRNVSGYVEIEFTEPSVGFWGVRFPTDRIGPVKEPTPIVSSVPAAPSTTSLHFEKKPEPPSAVFQKPVEAAAPAVESPAGDYSFDSFPFAPPTVAPKIPTANKTAVPASMPEQAAKSLDELLAELTATLPAPAKSTTQPKTTPQPELKIPAFEDLASYLVNADQNSANSSEDVSSKISATPSLSGKVSDAPAPPIVVPETKIENLPQPSASHLVDATEAQSGEIEMPAWLMPKVAPTQVVNRSAEPATKVESAAVAQAVDTVSDSSFEAQDSATSAFENTLTEGISGRNLQSAPSSRNGLWIGVAAAVLALSAGGYWYFQEPASKTVAAASNTPVSTPKAATPSPSSVAVSSRPLVTASTAEVDPLKAEPAPNDSSFAKNPPAPGLAGDAAVSSAPPPVSQPKVASLGKLHLAAPVPQARVSIQDSVAAPAFEQNMPSAAAMGANFGSATGQPVRPTAPLAIGGNVTPAKLLSSVQPVYSGLAKSQHVSGDVKIDAFIDANGRVTTMKFLSGPVLLQQPAMDALRQWKYQPAMLNGNPVSMHLTVTLQFRLQ
ncbi:MAG TPA: TonB family protein [Candidatus Dormibacteraeota bacterium]|nr:TonB family protein [Candidatus Dormibacteraeota bacterium]